MNNFKNFVIIVLSVVILVQSAFLFYLFSHRPSLGPKQGLQKAAAVTAKKPPSEAPPSPVAVVKPSEAVGRIALVLDDWGYTLKNKSFVTDNDYHVTLSILPFRAYSALIAQMAHLKGKDVIVHMPMEPHNKESYGLEENTLLTQMDKKTVVRLLDAAFGTVPNAKGLSNHMGSKATEDTALMSVVLDYLKNRRLFFLDSFVTSHSVARGLARKLRVGFTQRDVFIDNENDPIYIREQMNKLAQRAKRLGVAVGIGHDRPVTIAVLRDMIPQLEKEGYQFVNLSEVISLASQ